MRPSRMGAVVIASLVATFSARRALLLAAALAPPRSMQTVQGTPPSVALVIPVHDEAHQLEDLLAAIDRIDYPAERLALVLVDDCSSDGSTEMMRGWTERRPSTQLVTFSRPQGKASALMAGLAAVPGVELVAFCDA